MNDLYLSCVKCKEYARTAYKWTKGEFRGINIEPGKEYIDGDKMLNSDIWNVPSDDDCLWIKPVNEGMIAFLKIHAGHDTLVYSDRIEFELDDEYWYDPSDTKPCYPTARFFVEMHGSTCMTDIEILINNGMAEKPMWWGFESSHDEYARARSDFENAMRTLVESK